MMDHHHIQQFDFDLATTDNIELEKSDVVTNFEILKKHGTIYSFKESAPVEDYLKVKKIPYSNFRQVSMTLEDAFIGLTGKY